jgi:phosphoacetylglucosamine mutase
MDNINKNTQLVYMNLSYGTSGFRYPVATMLSLSYNIGQACCVLSHQKKKPIGIMITASHNPYTDNGVKIINYDGTMLSSEDETFMIDSMFKYTTYKRLVRKTTIVIGMDTRESSESIKQLLIKGIRQIDLDPSIIDLDKVTTPQLHHGVYKVSNAKYPSYDEAYFSRVCDLEFPHVVVDCANGVGAILMQKLVEQHSMQSNIILHHTNVSEYSQLNYKCGSDFIQKYGDASFCLMDHVLHASLDGDADRIICYYNVNDSFYLLDGDYISALFAYYFYKCINTTGLRVGVIHTNYANSNFISYIHSLGFHTKCSATGVKHLYRAAKEYDIGIFFESNGHGSVLFKNPHIDPDLSSILNPFIGDGITDLFAILYVLQELDISPKQWYGLFEKLPAQTYKMVVKNKDIFKTNQDQSRLISPLDLQFQLDDIMKSGCRVFIRPSGTEDIVRLHIEGPSMFDIEETKSLVRFSMWKYI